VEQKTMDNPQIHVTPCEPFADQRPGTAGLRKQVSVFQQPHYLECFAQATINTLNLPHDATVVIGGDGRYHNREAIDTLTGMLAAAGVARVVIGQGGLLSTPAASHLIRKLGADAGFILTASHNPGGPDGDFGIKFNTATGGQAPEQLTEAVYDATREIREYRRADLGEIDLSRQGVTQHGTCTVEIVDCAADYAQLMQSLFDFQRMSDFLKDGHRLVFDAMNGVTGPYAREIFHEQLGMPSTDILNGTPLEDFGGLHPDPNPVDAAELVAMSRAASPPDLLGASDGDGDRNMILGPGVLVSPGDSVAVMLANAHLIPGYRQGLPGVARSMPTSRAIDVVAEHMGIPCYETPTGWRFFCDLLEGGLIGLCGEESFGTSSGHVREKDGLWAILFWLDLIATRRASVAEILASHWARFGRNYFQRRDYFIENADTASELVEDLARRIPDLPGTRSVESADVFTYTDPVDGSVSANQGMRIFMAGGSRIVYRLSGTGTRGATLRVYLERVETGPGMLDLQHETAFEGLAARAHAIARITHYTGLEAATTVV
jgi:phosphoglucomutase